MIKDENKNFLEVPEVSDLVSKNLTTCPPDLERRSPILEPTCTPPIRSSITPQSSHTPPGTPPDWKRNSKPQSELEEAPRSLSCYFMETKSNASPSIGIESVGNTNSALPTADYIMGINKIDLGPRLNDLSKM